VCRHGSQAQGGAQADAMKGHLVDALFHRAKASFRCLRERSPCPPASSPASSPVELGVAV
jgi:hypothetical protein